MKIIAICGYDNTCIMGDTLEEVVESLDEEVSEYEFYELDLKTKFEVEMKPVRKNIPVRVKKEN